MAWVEVGSGSQRATHVVDSGTSASKAYPANVTNGSFLVTAGACFGDIQDVAPAVTDTRSTSYSVFYHKNGSHIAFIAYGVAPSGGACTVTVTPTFNAGGGFYGFALDEFSGPHATPLDVDGGFTDGTS